MTTMSLTMSLMGLMGLTMAESALVAGALDRTCKT